MPKRLVNTESYRGNLLKSLQDPGEAIQYLNACLEDGDPHVFLMALRDVAAARGGIRVLSREAHLNRESLYRMLSKSGNPSLESYRRSCARSDFGWRWNLVGRAEKYGERLRGRAIGGSALVTFEGPV
jgi:probable addiction module antidote protein